jgi:hypothetical protein
MLAETAWTADEQDDPRSFAQQRWRSLSDTLETWLPNTV